MADSDLHDSALKTARELEDDLDAIAASDLPFAEDAQSILAALDQAEDNQ